MPRFSQDALETLQRFGIILQSDSKLPSAASLVAGVPVSGSWWGQPWGQAMFQLTRQLMAHPDVIVTKLVSRKVTYVHRSLWPAIVGIGSAREPWQLEDLSQKARSLLDMLAERGELHTDRVSWPGTGSSKGMGVAVRDLENKLLIYSEEIHTSTGVHAKRIATWSSWAEWAGNAIKPLPREQGKTKLEQVLLRLNERFQANGRMPWRTA